MFLKKKRNYHDGTVARKSSIGGFYVCAGVFAFVQGGLDILV